jgi:hypothetical protein
MKLFGQDDKIMIKLAIYHIILGSIPQAWFGWQMLNSNGILDRAFTSPFTIILMFVIPGIFWKRFVTYLACKGTGWSTQEGTDNWMTNEPMLFWIPLFQFHSGVYYLFKYTIILSIRFIRGLSQVKEEDNTPWRDDEIYLIVKQMD